MTRLPRGFPALLTSLLVCLCLVSPAGSGCGMLCTGVGGPSAAAPSFSLTFQSSATSSNTSLTTIDFGTLTYGSGGTRILVAVEWYPNAAGTITGITIGGVALAQVPGAYVINANNAIDIWESTSALAGSSGDVQVTFSASRNFSSSIALYNLVTTTPTVAHAATATSPSGTSISSPITVPSGGGGLALSFATNGTVLNSFTNGTIDASLVGGFAYFGHTTATGAITVTGNYAGSDVTILSAATWGP